MSLASELLLVVVALRMDCSSDIPELCVEVDVEAEEARPGGLMESALRRRHVLENGRVDCRAKARGRLERVAEVAATSRADGCVMARASGPKLEGRATVVG